MIGGALEKRGYAVTKAASAEEAVAAAERTFFEIALLDVKMPGRSGLDLLADLKTANPDLQAIMVSAVITSYSIHYTKLYEHTQTNAEFFASMNS